MHFQSWSKAFDRWVTKDLLMKQTEENKAHQLKLAQTLIKEKNPRNVLTKFYEFITQNWTSSGDRSLQSLSHEFFFYLIKLLRESIIYVKMFILRIFTDANLRHPFLKEAKQKLSCFSN